MLRMSSRLKIVSKRMAQYLTTHTVTVNYKKGTKCSNSHFSGIPKEKKVMVSLCTA
jgi:hypothetical protein